MGWFSKLTGFENFFSKNLASDILHNPTRLITGVDPASTAVWNKVLGTDNEPLVNMVGGPGQKYFNEAEQAGIDTGPAQGFHKVADTIAGIAGSAGAAHGLGNLVGSVGGGGSLSTGAGGASAGGGGGFSLGNMGSIIGNAGKVLGAITDYQHNQQNKDAYNNLISSLNGMYAPGSPEEQLLRQKIEAQDAASGRRSQYGPREANLAGTIAQQRANILTNPTYGSYMNSVTGANSNAYNSLFGTLGGMFGNSGGSGNGTSNSILGSIGNLFGGNNTSGSNLQLGDDWMSQGKNLANSLFGGQ